MAKNNINEKKMFIISIVSILLILSIFFIIQSGFDINNNLTGKAIQNPIENEIISYERTYDYDLTDYRNCEAICPFGYEIVEANCNKEENSCSGNVVCGLYENEVLIDLNNGHCALINVVPDVN